MPHIKMGLSEDDTSGYGMGSRRHVTQSSQSGSQDSCLECWVRNGFWYQVASGIEAFLVLATGRKKST